MTYISCFSDFAFYFYYYFMENCHTWIIISMWQNDLHTNTSRSVWPILYGLMIKMLQYKMYPAGELAVLRQLLLLLSTCTLQHFSLSVLNQRSLKTPWRIWLHNEFQSGYDHAKHIRLSYNLPFTIIPNVCFQNMIMVNVLKFQTPYSLPFLPKFCS